MQYINSQEKLTNFLINEGFLKTSRIINGFSKIDRKDFVLYNHKNHAYIDEALYIGYEATISQPSVVAMMLERLQPQKGEKILEVGSGSGWVCCILAQIVGIEGKVYGTEIVSQLVKISKDNSLKYNLDNLEFYNAKESELGLTKKGPFNKILVSASGEEIPQSLINQLKVGGTMVIPIKNYIYIIYKDSSQDYKTYKHFGFSFVPLQ